MLDELILDVAHLGSLELQDSELAEVSRSGQHNRVILFGLRSRHEDQESALPAAPRERTMKR